MSEGSARPPSSPGAAPGRPRVPLHWQMLAALALGAAAGAVAGSVAPPEADGSANAAVAWFARNVAEPIGQVFLRLIFMVVVPLVFAALSLGVAGLGNIRKLGRVGLITLGLTVSLSVVSVGIGIALVNGLRPGAHVPREKRAELNQRFAGDTQKKLAQAGQARSVRDALLDIIPKNPLQEAVGALDGSSPGGGMLAVMFFALAVGVALTLAPQRAGPLVAVLEGVYDVCLAIIALAMRLAPLGVCGLVFALAATMGLDILRSLAWYVVTVLLGLSLHMLGVYSLLVAGLARLRPWVFFQRISEAILTAFGTSSSNATLPTALRVAEHRLGLRREVSSFVLTVGSTANQNGTALFEGITVLFLAQVFGVELSALQQVTVVLMSVLAGIGTAGVPGGSLPLIAILLQSVGIPAEGIAVILGVDRLLDMCRTTVNVTGDIAIAACVDRLERSLAPAAESPVAT